MFSFFLYLFLWPVEWSESVTDPKDIPGGPEKYPTFQWPFLANHKLGWQKNHQFKVH